MEKEIDQGEAVEIYAGHLGFLEKQIFRVVVSKAKLRTTVDGLRLVESLGSLCDLRLERAQLELLQRKK